MKTIHIVLGTLLAILLVILGLNLINNDETPSPSAVQNASNDVVHLKLGHNTAVDSALHDASVKFANEIKQKTDAKVIIDIFPAQQLGNDHQMVEMARNGELDIVLTPTAKMSVAVPSIQYADLPFYFPSREDVYAMLDGEPGQMILHNLKSIGLIGVAFWENGFKHFTANQPLLRVEDFKDKKFRVMKSRIIMEQFRALGAEPIAIDFYSTKQALHDKVVDGQENPLVAIASMGFYKEQSDLTLSEHAYLGYVFSFSEKTFNKLPQNIQMTLIDTAKEITPWEREETHKREKKLLEIIKNAGVHIHTITDEERHRFVQTTAYIPAKYEEIIGANIISKTKELLYNKYGGLLQNKDHILIGIDTDISSDADFAGLAIKRGAEIAVAEINAKGGVLGKPLEVIVKDHRAIATKGIQNVEEFSKNKHLAAIIGGVHGAVISAELETIQNLKIPYLIPWTSTAGIVKNGYEDNYVFRVSANDNIAAEFIAGQVLKKYKKPAIIVENSIWGRNNLKLMKEYLNKHNITDITEIVFNRGQNSFNKDISQVINSQADSIIMVANPIEASKVLQELKARQAILPIFSHWGLTSGEFYKKNKNILKEFDLQVFQTFSFHNTLNAKAKHLFESYNKRYQLNKNASIEASVGIAQAYDIVYLLKLAIEKAGTIEGTKVKEALENLPKYDGAVKNYTTPFTKTNHDALDGKNYYMARYNSKGVLMPITDK